MYQTTDQNGQIVRVGTKVRVLKVRASVVARLQPDEAKEVLSMVGDVLEVYEVDEWGSAWVKKWFGSSEDTAVSHSLALAPAEMELVH